MTNFGNYKGYIKCPFCGNKAMVMKNAHGQVSHKCECGKFILFDYDTMTAEPAVALRGGVKHFADNSYGRRLSR